MASSLRIIKHLEQLRLHLGDRAKYSVIGEVPDKDQAHPIYKIDFGNPDRTAPVLGFIGGVHGLERIGSEVCVALMNTLSHLTLWDQITQNSLKNIRIFFIPTVNPWGISHIRRSNANGVDLMRNAPVTATGPIPRLLGGHRHGSFLPWYRGAVVDNKPETMELENRILLSGVWEEIKDSKLVITVDVHSGFGIQDQLWFPYAKTSQPIPDIAEVTALFSLMENTYPNHFYKIEPQAYRTHGDFWDFVYDEHRKLHSDGVYIPLTLEMGSWNWLKKNPMQFFSREGAFHPTQPHRVKRILRRHTTFFDFLIRALQAPQSWAKPSDEQRHKFHMFALERWYNG